MAFGEGFLVFADGFGNGISQPDLLFFDRPDIDLDHIVTSGITYSFHPVIDPGGLVIVLVQLVLDDLGVGLRNGDLSLLFPVLRKRIIFQMPFDSVAVNPGQLGDFANTISVAMHGNNVYKYLLGDHWYPPSFLRKGVPHSYQGGTLFIPISGTLLHSR
jgi:hypothetical protein